MGVYNPYAPRILGQEWVPIRESPITLEPFVNGVEVGHRFTVAQSRTLQDGRFYINDWPSITPLNPEAILGVAIYPAGQEDLTGPIRRVIIPVTNVGITGNITTSGGGISPVAAVSSPVDVDHIRISGFGAGAPPSTMSMFFNTNAYSQLLQGKRILGVNLITHMSYDGTFTATNALRLQLSGLSQFQLYSNTGAANIVPPFALGSALVPPAPVPYTTFRYGEINPLGRDVAPIAYSFSDRMNWRYTDLQRFEAAPVNRITTSFLFFDSSDGTFVTISIGYVALEVIFCEEQRVALGMASFLGTYDPVLAPFRNDRRIVFQTNPILLRDPNTFSTAVTLPAGEYTAVVWAPDAGDLTATSGPASNRAIPPLNSIRELYSIPSHLGIQVNVPTPMDKTAVGKVFVAEQTHILPQISLHTSGGPLTEVHVYGKQAIAQVYGSITATQEIHDILADSAASWPWTRYVARRFGDTTVPLTLTGAGQSVSITPAEFDALDEILDGWKEVTLRFTNPPTMGAGTVPQFIWSATGELAGNRWEILGAAAPAISGTVGDLLVQTLPVTQRLGSATYGQPVSGSAINLGWVSGISPLVSATTDDAFSDAFIIFAQDMPTITGFSVSVLSQAVTGIGQQCGIDPCCIPTDILYNQINWGLPVNTGVAEDSFTRTIAAGSWGNADIGGTYSFPITPSDFSVNGTQGVCLTSGTSERFAVLSNIGTDFDIAVDTAIDNVVTGTIARPGVVGRYTDTGNHYIGRLDITPTGTVSLAILKRVATVLTTITTVNLPIAGGSGAFITIRFLGQGTLLKLKAWRTGDPEPVTWNLETSDASLTTGTNAGIDIDDVAASGNTYLFDNVKIGPPAYWFGSYELQRMDTVEPDWQTIMKATDPGTITFNDYEARIGIESSYRIRGVDIYDFPGPWSSTVTSTIPTPGISGGCISDGHILVFTSNERQSGSMNLAYSSVWMDSQVEENFTFPEAGFVQLQAMYDRDYVTAFRPLERGGETFSRTVLVQAAAIAPETLGDFRSLRDMAWDTTSYVCVRDEDGNRWLATVLVPSGKVLRDRRLYLAPVNIIEVTDTPSPADP